MATVTTTTTTTRAVVTATNAVCVCTPETNELFAHAECLLRLEDLGEKQQLQIQERLESEKKKLFKTLCASPELSLAKLLETWKTYEAASTQVETEAKIVSNFQAMVSSRIVAFEQRELMRAALQKRQQSLVEELRREQQDTIVVKNRLSIVEDRLKDFTDKAATEAAEVAAATAACAAAATKDEAAPSAAAPAAAWVSAAAPAPAPVPVAPAPAAPIVATAAVVKETVTKETTAPEKPHTKKS